MNEDVFPIEAGDFPVSHVDFPGRWFQVFFSFTPIRGEMIQFDKKNLKPPTSPDSWFEKESGHRQCCSYDFCKLLTFFSQYFQAFAKPRMEISPRTELHNLFREIFPCYFSGTSSGIVSPLPTWVIYALSPEKTTSTVDLLLFVPLSESHEHGNADPPRASTKQAKTRKNWLIDVYIWSVPKTDMW